MNEATIKRGDTFRATVTRRTSAGVAVNLAGYTVRMQLRDPLEAVVASSFSAVPTLVVTVADHGTSPGVLTVRASAAVTATWPTGVLTWDIEYVEPGPGDTRSSETLRLIVVPDVTR